LFIRAQEEREYIRDQQSKTGTREIFQLTENCGGKGEGEGDFTTSMNEQTAATAGPRLGQVWANPVYEVC
jgi:hypothetical protein